MRGMVRFVLSELIKAREKVMTLIKEHNKISELCGEVNN